MIVIDCNPDHLDYHCGIGIAAAAVAQEHAEAKEQEKSRRGTTVAWFRCCRSCAFSITVLVVGYAIYQCSGPRVTMNSRGE